VKGGKLDFHIVKSHKEIIFINLLINGRKKIVFHNIHFIELNCRFFWSSLSTLNSIRSRQAVSNIPEDDNAPTVSGEKAKSYVLSFPQSFSVAPDAPPERICLQVKLNFN